MVANCNDLNAQTSVLFLKENPFSYVIISKMYPVMNASKRQRKCSLPVRRYHTGILQVSLHTISRQCRPQASIAAKNRNTGHPQVTRFFYCRFTPHNFLQKLFRLSVFLLTSKVLGNPLRKSHGLSHSGCVVFLYPLLFRTVFYESKRPSETKELC